MNKRIIINNKQLKKINEMQTVMAKTNDVSGAVNAINDHESEITGTTPDQKQVCVQFPVQKNGSNDGVYSTTTKKQLETNPTNDVKQNAVEGDNLLVDLTKESIVLTKKQIEEARIKNIKENGIRYTKAELIEMVKNNY